MVEIYSGVQGAPRKMSGTNSEETQRAAEGEGRTRGALGELLQQQGSAVDSDGRAVAWWAGPLMPKQEARASIKTTA